MKKLVRNLVALSLSVIIGAMSFLPVSAAVARSYPCDACGRGEVYAYTTYTAWEFDGYKNCPHCGDYPVYKRTGTTNEKCTNCPVVYHVRTWDEYDERHNN